MATALDRIMNLVDHTIDQVESGESIDHDKLIKRLDLETVRAGVEFAIDADTRTRNADGQLFAN